MISTIKTMAGLGVLLLTTSFHSPCHAMTQQTQATKPNTLTEQEKKEGWKLLFDGKSFDGWRGAYLETMPARGWELRDGMMVVQESGGDEAAFGGDIVTVGEYSSFELTLDFKLTKGANSGIKYFVTEQQPKTPGSAIGLEYQLLDDTTHPDAHEGIHGNRRLASVYDVIPATNAKANPVGEWNHARILVQGKHVEHWLNGVRVVEYERGGKDFLAHKAESKFKDRKDFGEAEKGHILLQEHGNQVFFRNIKIRTF